MREGGKSNSRPVLVGLFAALSLTPLPTTVHAQSDDELAAFLETVRRENSRFAAVEVAVREGYRKLGPDFPGMGEHWIHPGRVIAGRLDPRAPPVLTYTEVAGQRQLVGFAYTSALGPNDQVPSGPFPRSAWHDHSAGVDEESLLLSGPASMHAAGDGYRLAMVHIWIPLENPDGVLSQNNWLLPVLRAGIRPAGPVSSEAGRGLSLGGVGLAFYEQVLRDGIGMEKEDLDRALERFTTARDRVVEIRGNVADRQLSDEQVRQLEVIWTDLWRDLEETPLPTKYPALGHLGPTDHRHD